MPVNHWNTWTYFDPATADEAICLTGYTGRGAYWIRAPRTQEGKTRRAQREEFVARIEAAVHRDDERVRDGKAAAELGEVSTADPLLVREATEGEHGRREEDRGIW